MPKLSKNRVPSYRLHKQSGQAIVTLSGRDFLLGKHGSEISHREYDRLIAEWVANGRQLIAKKDDISIAELLLMFWKHMEDYYRDSREPVNYKLALRPLRELYAHTPVAEFTPQQLLVVRTNMIQRGWSRNHINKCILRVKSVFRWGVEQNVVPANIMHALNAVKGLRFGRTEARETDPVEPVDEALFEATLPHLTPSLRAMVQVQKLTGMRPGELCQLRPVDIDMTGEVWVFRPPQHKTKHLKHLREVVLGPKARELLQPYLPAKLTDYVFSPAQSEQERRAAMHARRKTPLNQGNRPGTNRVRKPKRPAGACWTVQAYGKAIKSACRAAFPLPPELRPAELPNGERETLAGWRARLTPEVNARVQEHYRTHSWHPYQLRHNAATDLFEEFGLETAGAVLGHRRLETTQIYVQRRLTRAIDAMVKLG